MSDLGNPDVPRSWADASEDLYSPVSVSFPLSGEAGLSTNEDAHMEVNPSSVLPSASSCDPGVVLSHPSAFDSSPSYLGSSPMNVSYAAAVTRDRPSLNGGSTAARSFVTRSFLSRFEKDHFHPHNVTPDRPCTAFFTLEDTAVTSKQIFDSLIRDGIPASAVRCLQRAPNGTVHISFSNSDFRDLFVSKSSFIVANRTTVPHPARAKLVFVTVYGAPYELPDTALDHRLKKYGRIYSSRRGRVQGFPNVFNGMRHYRMDITSPIPCYLRFGKFLLRVQYDNQPKTCRRCNGLDHLAKDCQNLVCFNCDSIGHVSRSCPDSMKCCICKEHDHVAIDCPFSWFRRPHSYRDTVDPSVGENARAGETLSDTDDDDDDDDNGDDDNGDDDNGDAAVNDNDDSDAASMSASLSADPEVPSVTPPDAPVLRCDALDDADDPNDISEEPEVTASEQVDLDSASAIEVSPPAGVLPFRRKRPRPDRDASGGQDFDVDLFEPT